MNTIHLKSKGIRLAIVGAVSIFIAMPATTANGATKITKKKVTTTKKNAGTVSTVAGSAATTAVATTVAAGAAAAAAGPTTTAAPCALTGDPVTVAYIADFSGNPGLATIGVAGKAGADTVTSIVNNTGGIHCHKLVLDTYDTVGGNPDVFATVLRQALAKKPVAFTGNVLSAAVAAQLSTIIAARVPWVSTIVPVAATESIPFIFSTSVTGPDHAAVLAKAALQLAGGNLKGKRIAITGSANSVTVDELVTALKSDLEALGATVPGSLVFRDPALITDWTSQASNTVSGNADMLIIAAANDPSAAVVIDASRIAGFKGQILTGVFNGGDALFRTVANPNYYSLRDVNYPSEGTALLEAVRNARGTKQDANASAYFSREFAAMYVIASALRACDLPCGTDDFVKAVRGLGPVDVPFKPLPAPVDFSKRNSRPLAATLWNFDLTKDNAPKQVGGVLTP